MYRLKTSILLLVMLLFSGYVASYAETHATESSIIKEKKRELDRVRRQLKQSKQQLQGHRRKEQSILDRLDTLSRRQAALADDVHTTSQKLQAAQERAEALQAAHDRLSDRLEHQRQRLRQRVRQLYKLGQLPYVKLLLSAKDVAEFSRKVQYIQHLATHDRQQLEQYHAGQAELANAQSELATALRQTQATRDRLREKRDALAQERQHQAVLLSRVRDQQALAAKAVSEFTQAADDLAKLIVQKQKQAKARRPKPIRAAVKGQLWWPLDGSILSAYGRVRHPTFDVVTIQQGMYIGAPFGHEVRVVADGRVVYADWFKGLGRLLLVDHGNHIVTLYGHTSAILVRVGDVVYGRQVVAKVGDSSPIGEPALYFAVRHKTAPQDPLQWLRQRTVRLTSRPEDRAGELQ